jgi:hypothetical protein
VDVEQESATGLAGELLGGHTYGQTFTLQYDGLYRLDLYTATYARTNTQPIILRILPSPACGGGVEGRGEELLRQELPAAQVSNSGPTVITFPPIAGTAGHTLGFSIESPGSTPGDAITVYRNDKDVYADGQMFVDGQPTSGDLAFIAYTQETFTPADIWNDFYLRARQDRPFWQFYCLLLGVLVMALGVTLAWRGRSTASAAPKAGDQPPADETRP